MYLINFHLCLRETEYKGLQLSLDQATSKTTFPYSNSSTSSLTDNCRTAKSRGSRPKTKARLSPYTQVQILVFALKCPKTPRPHCKDVAEMCMCMI